MDESVLYTLKNTGRKIIGPKARRVYTHLPEQISLKRCRTFIKKRLKCNAKWAEFHMKWLAKLEIENDNCRHVYKLLTQEMDTGRLKADTIAKQLMLMCCTVDKAHKYFPSRPIGKGRMTVEEQRKWYGAFAPKPPEIRWT